MMTDQPVKHILIVDDDRFICDFLTSLLSSEDRAVYTAATIAEARELLHKNSIDLILLDLNLPDGSGIKLLSELKHGHNGGTEHHPSAIIMTAFGNWETHMNAYKLGAFYYLDKPFKVSQLRTLVEQALTA